ncbi:ester cyclase [Bradyrhizobium sp. Tv2a-2]|uniref:ester cyclase n=1 Tax=Bradyrhizobium sp. Tv2a-2 TaxID=113395 RepID=UPI00040BDBA5|nr:ester cyclase [Bradyrhizobium sp. Tv2a-2]
MERIEPGSIGRRELILHRGVGLTVVAAALCMGSDIGKAGAADDTSADCNRLLDRYLAAVNAHDTSKFSEIFTESYIQHSGRSPSGLESQIANYQRIFENWPDFQSRIDDRIFGGDKIVVRTTLTATHTRNVQGFAPTGKRVTWGAIDIWRVENGKLAEHWDVVDIASLQKQLRGE